MTNELTEYKNSPVDNAIKFLQNGGNIEQLEKMMELQERYDANEAKKAFNEAMTKAQNMMPVIPRTSDNKQTKSKYAKHEDVLKLAKPIYTEEGFSLMFYEGETKKENHIRIMVDIRHSKGHMETRFMDLAVDDVGMQGTRNKTTIHGETSTFSYGQRRLTCAIFNIPTGDDEDGNQPKQTEKRVVTPEDKERWKQTLIAYKRDKGFKSILMFADISEDHKAQVVYEVARECFEKFGNFDKVSAFEGLTEEIKNRIIDEER